MEEDCVMVQSSYECIHGKGLVSKKNWLLFSSVNIQFAILESTLTM